MIFGLAIVNLDASYQLLRLSESAYHIWDTEVSLEKTEKTVRKTLWQ